MAAYAALNSVMYILQQIQHHPRPPITIQKQHMDSLCEIISFLQDFLEKYSHRDMGECKEALESRIADAAYAAEDVIESHIVDQILAEKSSYNLICQDLQKVIEDMELIKKKVIEIQEKIMRINDDQLPRNIISMSTDIIGSSTVPPPKRKNTNSMVGFDDVLIQIIDRLTGHPPNRQVLPIVGMGGIGKTTLARNVYDHRYIRNQFDVRIWVTISQEYRLRDILLQALSCLHNDENKCTKHELGDQLYKSLYNRRYLIVLDDMWSIEAWEELMLFFPDNNNGSRIMITTRILNVSNHFGSCVHKMKFLDEDESWNLLCKTVLPQGQCCPPELEKIGKKIARNCKGLPLSITVIGGLLAKSEKTQQHWEYIAENLNPIINLEDDMHCSRLLYLSYNHLHIHLKPCFLYMGVFSEDSIIPVSRLKKLWAAEGFLKPIATKSLEVVAEEYLKDLMDRNLFLVHELGSGGKVKYCKIHDLLRDLCLREGTKHKFLWGSKMRDFDNIEGIQSQRRISAHEGESNEYLIDKVLKDLQPALLARSVICDFKGVHMSSHSFRLARVFIMGSIAVHMDWSKNYEYSLEDVFKLVNSRYLDLQTKWKSLSIVPSSIRLLWNLQTLIIKGSYWISELPPEIWEMSLLRHLEILCSFPVPDPPNVPLINKGDDDFILKNLNTLQTVVNFKLREEVIKRIPNIKKLKVLYREDDSTNRSWLHGFCLNNLVLLNKLESLNIDSPDISSKGSFLPDITFPQSLKKLSLSGINLLCKDMKMIGLLPHLQVLTLKSSSFGTAWNPVEGEFLCLKFLKILWWSDLECWEANSSHFPSLEKLFLLGLPNLKEIPLEIGEIPTLGSIILADVSTSAVMSVKNLFDERVELGNEDLQVQVEVFRQKNSQLENSQLERLATHNFQIWSYLLFQKGLAVMLVKSFLVFFIEAVLM